MHLRFKNGNVEGGSAALRYITVIALAIVGLVAFIHGPAFVGSRISSSEYTYFFEPTAVPSAVSSGLVASESVNVRRLTCAPSTRPERESFGPYSYKCTAAMHGVGADEKAMVAFNEEVKTIIAETYSPTPSQSGTNFSHGFSENRQVFGFLSEDRAVGVIKILVGVFLVGIVWSSVRRSRTLLEGSQQGWVATASIALLPCLVVSAYTVIVFGLGGATDPGGSTDSELITAVWRGLLIAPIAEELVFRVWLLTFLERVTGSLRAVFLSSVAFSLAHAPAHWLEATLFLIVGGFLGWLWVRARSISLNVLSHLAANAAVLVLTVLVFPG